MDVASSRRALHVPLQCVSTIEELTDISTDIMLHYKPAARVLEYKVFDTEHHIVKYHVLFALLEHRLLKLIACHHLLR